MKIISRLVASAAAAWALGPGSGAAKTDAPRGLWIWDTGDAAVVFHLCGRQICGRIVWLKDDQANAPLLDLRNPDARRRNRRLCGIDYITGLRPTAGGDLRGGRIYDFRTGKSYDLDIDSIDAARVRMRGYMGVRLVGADLVLLPLQDAPGPGCAAEGDRRP